jgi:hypothetical protein
MRKWLTILSYILLVISVVIFEHIIIAISHKDTSDMIIKIIIMVLLILLAWAIHSTTSIGKGINKLPPNGDYHIFYYLFTDDYIHLLIEEIDESSQTNKVLPLYFRIPIGDLRIRTYGGNYRCLRVVSNYGIGKLLFGQDKDQLDHLT